MSSFFGPLSVVEQLDVAVDGPAAALVDLQVDRDVDVPGEVDRVALLVPLAVELVHHDVEPGLVVLRVVQQVHEVRPGGHVGVLQPLGDPLSISSGE